MIIPKDLARTNQGKRDDLLDEVRADWLAARDARRDREERALHDIELYSRKRRDAEAEMVARQGFSKIEVPLIYWIVEHMMPRLGVQAPTLTVNATSPEAVPYAQAKQMRMQHHLDSCGWDIPYQFIQKSKLVIGDGIAKVPWDHEEMRPGIIDVDWFDFFVSSECTRLEAAAVHFHRSYLTKRRIEMMRGQRDAKDKPLWHNLDDLAPESTREHLDDTWGRRAYLGESGGSVVGEQQASGLVPVIECWYSTGEYVVLGGDDYATLLRAEMSPFRRRKLDGSFRYLRPFAFFRNTIDPFSGSPYSTGEAQALEHHQVEISSMRNAWMDQMNVNVNAPTVYDESMDGAMVAEAFSRPGGLLAVPWGASGPPIMRMPPGQVTADFPALYAMIRNEGELVSGMNDNAAGQAVDGAQTATEVQILASEANWRIRLKRRMDEIAMHDVAMLFDSHDRQYGGIVALAVEPGFRADEGARGFLNQPGAADGIEGTLALMAGANRGVAIGPPGVARIGPEVNQPGATYQIEIDAGSAARPDQMEEAQKMNALIGALSHPNMAPLVDWVELTRTVLLTHGQTPEKLMAQQAPAAQMPGAPGEAAPPGQEQAPPPPMQEAA